jgi:lipopolysaccharide export system protein LptA
MRLTEQVLCGLCGLLLLVSPPPSWALESDKDQPLEISADSVEIDENQGVSVYRGNVDARQGSMHLLADVVTIRHPEHKAQRIEASGNPVRFNQTLDKQPKEIQAKALRVEYDIAGDEIQLIDQAEVRQGEDTFRSDRITYDRQRALVRAGASAKGKERVHVTVKPGGR